MGTNLSCNFTKLELDIIEKFCGKDYKIVDKLEGNHFILNMKGNLYYNDCFKETKNDFLANRKYEHANPNRIIKFYHYYIMETKNEIGLWYRGTELESMKFEYDICGESLEEIFDSL